MSIQFTVFILIISVFSSNIPVILVIFILLLTLVWPIFLEIYDISRLFGQLFKIALISSYQTKYQWILTLSILSASFLRKK